MESPKDLCSSVAVFPAFFVKLRAFVPSCSLHRSQNKSGFPWWEAALLLRFQIPDLGFEI
jgi:hypothetical protein